MNSKKIKKVDVFKYELIFILITLNDFYNYIIQGVFTNNKNLFFKALLYYSVGYLLFYIIRKLYFYDKYNLHEYINFKKSIKNKFKAIKKAFINKIINTLTKLENIQE